MHKLTFKQAYLDPRLTNADLKKLFGISKDAILKKAKDLGVYKSEWCCEQCGMKTNNKKNLRKHLDIHDAMPRDFLVKRFREGATYHDISKEVGMSESMVQYTTLSIYEINPVQERNYKFHEGIDEAVEMYEKGASLLDVAKAFETNDSYVKNRFKDLGLHLRSHSEQLQICDKNRGKNHYAWNPDITDEERLNGRGLEYKHWAYKVKEQGEFVCDCCGKESEGDLQSHHLEAWQSNLDLRYELSNGVCLCNKCHWSFHAKYGRGDTTASQYKEFKEILNG
jgi:AraC-like DNA-binding protein